MILNKAVQPHLLPLVPLPFKPYTPAVSSHAFDRLRLRFPPCVHLVNFSPPELTLPCAAILTPAGGSQGLLHAPPPSLHTIISAVLALHCILGRGGIQLPAEV